MFVYREIYGTCSLYNRNDAKCFSTCCFGVVMHGGVPYKSGLMYFMVIYELYGDVTLCCAFYGSFFMHFLVRLLLHLMLVDY